MSIKVEISTHNLEMTDRLREYVTKKASKLDRYLDVLEEAKVDLSYVKSARSADDRQVAQLTVRGKGVVLRAEERTDDMFASFDAVIDKIHRQIERYKGRRWRSRGDGRSVADFAHANTPGVETEADEQPRIVRRKRFQLAPMNEAEALEQMIMLGHENFFVFLNADTQQINVLYRRRDGTYGIIETEIA